MATKKEILRQQRQSEILQSLGFTQSEAEQLRRISMTLQRWHELECGVEGGCVERDEKTGKVYWLSAHTGKRWPYADRETGALRRLNVLIDLRNARQYNPNGRRFEGPMDQGAVLPYIQTDPRGAALYLIRPGDVPAGEDAGAYYSRGICVY